MSMNMNRNYLLNSVFIVALALLVLNDFWLKNTYHNALTGKLSDVAGLTVFALFLLTFLEKKRIHVFVGVVVFFAWWKSPFSQGAIDLWNRFPFFDMQRTVDYGDLLCLLVLIPLWYFHPKELKRKIQLHGFAFYPLLFSAAFMFFATSRMSRFATQELLIDEDVRTVSNKTQLIEAFTASSARITPHQPIIISKDTLDGFVLEDVIIDTDTLHKVYIGISDRKKGAEVYISHILFPENEPIMIETSSYRSCVKRYKKQLNAFVEEIDKK